MDSNTVRQTIPLGVAWRLPLGPERYDCRPLSLAERAALAVLVDGQVDGHLAMNSAARRAAEVTLARLSRPLHEVYALRRKETSRRALATRVLFRQMHRRGRVFWQWTAQEWQDVVGATAAAFDAANALPCGRNGRQGLRPHLLDVAYLLCGFAAFGPLWMATAFYPMARVVFGADLLDGQIARLDAILANEGYATGHGSMKQRHQAISFVLLVNRSPWLADLSWETVDRAAAMASAHAASVLLGKVSAALVALGILAPRADPAQRDLFPPGSRDGVPDEWYAWYLAWRAIGSRGLAPASRATTAGTSCTLGAG